MTTHARAVGWVIFWVATVILTLLVVPVMHNTSAIPAVIFAVIVLALASALWGGGTFGRQWVARGATLVLVLMSISFFFPRACDRAPKLVVAADDKLATAESLRDIFPQSDDKPASVPAPRTAPVPKPAKPVRETGFASYHQPLRVYLDPQRVHTRASRPLVYELEGHPDVVFEDDFSGRRNREWWSFPADWYLVYPREGNDEVAFQWWND